MLQRLDHFIFHTLSAVSERAWCDVVLQSALTDWDERTGTHSEYESSFFPHASEWLLQSWLECWYAFASNWQHVAHIEFCSGLEEYSRQNLLISCFTQSWIWFRGFKQIFSRQTESFTEVQWINNRMMTVFMHIELRWYINGQMSPRSLVVVFCSMVLHNGCAGLISSAFLQINLPTNPNHCMLQNRSNETRLCWFQSLLIFACLC